MRVMKRLVPLVLLLCACSGSRKQPAVDRDTLTQRQKDSITATLPVPGAKAVGKALEVSDSAAARNAVIDSLSR